MKFGMVKEGGLIETYLRLKETGATGDFPNVLANVLHKMLIKAFKGVPTSWRNWCKVGELGDFKTADRAWLSEGQDLLEITEEAPYQNMKIKDRKYQITLATFGRTFQIMRKTVINDDLQAFKDIPKIVGRVASRSLAKKICAKLETNSNAYDGNPLFYDRSSNGTNNAGMTVLSADATGISTVQTGVTAIRNATDPDSGEKVGAVPMHLVVSPSYEWIAKNLVHSTEIRPVSTSGGSVKNPLTDLNLQISVEPFLTSFPGRFYLLADPEEFPTIEVSFLNGQEEPELFQKGSESVRLNGGGRDDYGYEFDDISYKVRHDWGVAVGMYQGAYKGGS